MNGYFKPLRRKIGVVALAFLVVWTRSGTFLDYLGFCISDRVCSFQSFRAVLHLDLCQPKKTPAFMTFGCMRQTDYDETFRDEGVQPDVWFHPQQDQSAWIRPVYFAPYKPNGALTRISIPFWSMVPPLTLLSAYLLLSKPRAGKVA